MVKVCGSMIYCTLDGSIIIIIFLRVIDFDWIQLKKLVQLPYVQ